MGVMTVANVVTDFGAVGDGTTDDTAAIQAAVDSLVSGGVGNGVVYFPLGTYKLTESVTFEESTFNIAFVGCPGATIIGDFADALLKRSPNSPFAGVHTIENLTFVNENTDGKAVMLHSCVSGKVVNCQFSADAARANSIGIETFNSSAVTIDSCRFTGFGVAVMAGNASYVLDCDITGCVEGIRHQSLGLVITGGRYEVNDIAINLGVDENGNPFTSSGVEINGLSMESNGWAIVGETGCAEVQISACGITGGQMGLHGGIWLNNASNVVISGTVISFAQSIDGAGILIEASARRIVLQGVECNLSGGTDYDITFPQNVSRIQAADSNSVASANVTIKDSDFELQGNVWDTIFVTDTLTLNVRDDSNNNGVGGIPPIGKTWMIVVTTTSTTLTIANSSGFHPSTLIFPSGPKNKVTRQGGVAFITFLGSSTYNVWGPDLTT